MDSNKTLRKKQIRGAIYIYIGATYMLRDMMP